MSITAKQALDAIYHLQHAHNKALLAHYADKGGVAQRVFLDELKGEFLRASAALGFKVVTIEENQLRVIEGGAAS